MLLKQETESQKKKHKGIFSVILKFQSDIIFVFYAFYNFKEKDGSV